MLDDQKYINQVDKSDALGIILKQAEQLEYTFNLGELDFPVENIVFAGMGGSALAAQLSLAWPGYSVPFEICRSYTLPQYANEKTLFIASSYSGNTEETLSALDAAITAGCHIITVSAGGKLAEISAKNGLTHLGLPEGIQPRYAVLYSFKAFITVLERCGFVSTEKAEQQVHLAASFLTEAMSAWRSDVPTVQNQAKRLAEAILGKTPIIYGGLLYPAAYKWKINFNENAKNTAWCNQLPEFNHNEFLGWTSHPVEKPFAVIDLVSSYDHPRMAKRFELSDKLLSGKRPKSTTINAVGETLLEQLLWTVALGDMVSVYLAILNNVDPTPVDLIEKFKKEMA